MYHRPFINCRTWSNFLCESTLTIFPALMRDTFTQTEIERLYFSILISVLELCPL